MRRHVLALRRSRVLRRLAASIFWGAFALAVGLMVPAVVSHSTAWLDLDDSPGAGIVDRTEVLAIWLPQALLDLARAEADPAGAQTPEELRTRLDRSGSSLAWYAVTYRGHQANGGFADITLIRRPTESPEGLRLFQHILSHAAGRPTPNLDLDFTHARIGVIPDRLSTADPVEAVAELVHLTHTLAEKSAEPISGPDRLPE